MNSKLGDLLNLVNQMVLSIENGIDYNNEPKNGKLHEYVKQAKNLLFENNWHDYCNNWNDARTTLPNREIIDGEESHFSELKVIVCGGVVCRGLYDLYNKRLYGSDVQPDYWADIFPNKNE